MYKIWVYYLLIKHKTILLGSVSWNFGSHVHCRLLDLSVMSLIMISFSVNQHTKNSFQRMSKICTQWTTKTLNMSLKDSMWFLAITYGKTYLHFPYKTHFCNTHSGWLQLPVAASSGTLKHLITEIRLTRPRVRRGRWIVVNLRCRRWMFNYNIHIT